jgi:hypothetical protein
MQGVVVTAIGERTRQARRDARLDVKALVDLVSATQAVTGVLTAMVSSLIMIHSIALTIVDLRARRRGRPSILGPA